ncbi:cysteine-rich venom protein triflin-like [Elgaria multicarinata webbii]|uniref:cysteine-rich venom protein triflin-like n=1 Tax=Elgaria multicarinata webbii TaxID=159646 RepID=UPI002FCD2000
MASAKDRTNRLSEMDSQKQKEILDNHNAIRRDVQPSASNMLKMTWSDKAKESAEKWAKKCIPKSSPSAERTVDGVICSDNILQSTYSASWSEVIQVWQSKKSNFEYGLGAINAKRDVYSYTQLIWYKSHEVGCALAYCPQNAFPFLFVCHYCPAGNIVEKVQTPYDEGPPCEACPNNCEDKLCTNPCIYVDMKMDCPTLISLFSCEEPAFGPKCQATCKCKAEIK